MKILYIKKKTFTQFYINNFEDAKASDLVIFAFDCIKQINIDDEIEKRSQTLVDVCKLTASLKAVIIVFTKLKLNSASKVINAALVIKHGKLIGICDEIDINTSGSEASINIFETGSERMCVLVGDNAKVAEFMQIAGVFGCNLVVAGVDKSSEQNTSLARFYLSELNINTIICGANKVEIFSNGFETKQKTNVCKIVLSKNKPKKLPDFYKYLHKTICDNFN